MPIKLNPCPFCGNEHPTITKVSFSDHYEIRCPECDTVFRLGAGEKERIEARIAAAWNRRQEKEAQRNG